MIIKQQTADREVVDIIWWAAERGLEREMEREMEGNGEEEIIMRLYWQMDIVGMTQ